MFCELGKSCCLLEVERVVYIVGVNLCVFSTIWVKFFDLVCVRLGVRSGVWRRF